jgi:diketogulonate reductase-like aldo/keto reductase
MPRFQGDNLRRNLALVEELKGHAAAERCTPAQLALAWLLARRPFIVPIAGTSRKTPLPPASTYPPTRWTRSTMSSRRVRRLVRAIRRATSRAC